MSEGPLVQVYVQGQPEPLQIEPDKVRGKLGQVWIDAGAGTYLVLPKENVSMYRFSGMDEAAVEKAMAKINAGR